MSCSSSMASARPSASSSATRPCRRDRRPSAFCLAATRSFSSANSFAGGYSRSRPQRTSSAPVVVDMGRKLPRGRVDLTSAGDELGRLLLLPQGDGLVGGDAVGLGVLAYVVADAHRAELGPAHRAEVGGLGRLGREGRVVVRARRVGVERKLELILPEELEAGR